MYRNYEFLFLLLTIVLQAQGRANGPKALSGRIEIICESSIRNIPFGKHIVRQSFQLGERHVLHGMLYLANQLVSLVIVIIAQA